MLSIHIDRKRTFLPEEIVKGQVIFQNNRKCKVHGIYIRFKGMEYTCWQKTKGEIPPTISESRKKNYLFKVVETLYGDPWDQKKKKKTIIHINEYRWNFSFQLPKDIPPTVVYKKGKSRIVYIMKAHVKIPKGNSIKYSEEVVVGSLYKYDPTISPIHSKEETAPFTSKNRKLLMTVMTKRNVSYSHDDFNLELHINNGLPQTLKHVDFKIIRFLKSGDHIEKKTIARYRSVENFPVRSMDVYNRVLVIKMPPNMLPTCLGKLLQITYHLKVIIPINSFKKAKLSVPLIICSSQFEIQNTLNGEQFYDIEAKRIFSSCDILCSSSFPTETIQVDGIVAKPEAAYCEQGLHKKMSHQVIYNQ